MTIARGDDFEVSTGETATMESTTLTRADLVEAVASAANLTKKDTELIVETLFEFIAEALAKGDKVELRGFGSFRIRQRRPRRGRNPKTGSGVSVPEKRVPFFKVGRRVRELVDRGQTVE